ncbi:ABC transporter permease [Celerinatantimonas sp. YJH-8]|uniref:ABC transporter permease n=1 Tax=Celerinatantimonas sp. YJH-8 TaxID=3228714 RepID=UPI0038BF5A61
MNNIKTSAMLSHQSWRLWHSGFLKLMSYAIILCVVCIVSGRYLSESLKHHFGEQSTARFGADRSLSIHREQTLPDRITELALSQSRSVVFDTMAYHGDKMQLVRVRATDRNFPLRGQWQRTPELPLKPGEIWLDQSAMLMLDVHIGDRIDLGSATLTVAGTSLSEPSGATRSFWFLPTVVIDVDDLVRTKAIGPSSRVQYLTDFSGNKAQLQQLDQLALSLSAQWHYHSATDLNQRTQQLFLDGKQLIGLAVSLIVLLCFYTLLIAMRGYSHQLKPLLLLAKILGCPRRKAWMLVFVPVALVFVIATGLGYGVSVLVYGLAQMWGPAWLSEGFFEWQTLWWGMTPLLMGLLLTVTAFVPMLHQRYRQLLSQATPIYPLLGCWIICSLAELILLLDNWRWVTLLLSIVMVAIVIVSLLRRWGSGLILKRIKKVSSQFAQMQLSRVNFAADSLILGLSLALGLTAGMWSIQHQLLQRWLADLPANTPNYFLLNLEPSSISELTAQARQRGIQLSLPYSVVRGRMTAINGRPLCQQQCAEDEPQAPGRELNLTQSSVLPAGNQIIQGQWWHSSAEKPGVSFEAEFAKRMHVQVGDQITFLIYGYSFQLPVLSIRSVNWQTFQPNFYIVFSPRALEDYPGMVLLSAYLPESQRSFLQQVRQLSPGMNAVDISQILSMTRNLLGQLSLILKVIALLLVVAAALLMNAQLAIGLFERRQQVSVLRLLGATHQVLKKALFLEFGILGLISSILAIVISEVMLSWLGQWLSLDWAPEIGLWPVIVAVGLAIIYICVRHFIAQVLKSVDAAR